MGVTVKSDLQFTEGSSLNLVSILQLLNPLGFVALKAGDFALNSHTLFVLFINFTNKFTALLLSLHLLLHVTSLKSFLFLITNHLLHRLVFKLLSMLLDLDHFLMLVALTLNILRVINILGMLIDLLVFDGILLFSTNHLVFIGQSSFLGRAHLSNCHLLGSVISIALTHMNNIGGLFLGLLNFFPCLLFLLLQESNSVGQKLDVFLSALAGNALLSESRADWASIVLVTLALIFSFILFLVLLSSELLTGVLFYFLYRFV